MTCKQCFGDQTIWRRDATGKAVEVPCACVGVSSAAIDILVPTEAAPIPTGVTFANVAPRPAFDELKIGDVVWLPAQAWRDMQPGQRHLDLQINGVAERRASVFLTREEYDALPPCPMAVDDRYRLRISPEEQPKNAEMVHWWDGDGWLSSDGLCMPFRCVWRYQPPPPPEQP